MLIRFHANDYQEFHMVMDELCEWLSENTSPQLTHMHGINHGGFWWKDGKEADIALYYISHKRLTDLYNAEMNRTEPGSFFIFLESDYFHHIVSEQWEVFGLVNNERWCNIYAFVHVSDEAAIYLKLKYGS